MQRKIFGFRDIKNKQIAVYLLGQLGRNDLYSNFDLSGSDILKEVDSIFLEINKLIAGKVILVECQNNEQLKKFYEQNKFIYLQNHSEKKKYIQMIKIIK